MARRNLWSERQSPFDFLVEGSRTPVRRRGQEHRNPMIEALKSDEIVNRIGGRFKLCALIQRRLVQLMDGARPLVERNGRSDLELVIEEIAQGKISYEFDPAANIDTKSILLPAER
jgi:DNA-directed RNA polymerase subunit omega